MKKFAQLFNKTRRLATPLSTGAPHGEAARSKESAMSETSTSLSLPAAGFIKDPPDPQHQDPPGPKNPSDKDAD